MVVGAPLEDARHLAQRYDRMRQDAEAQVLRGLSFTWLFETCCFHLNFSSTLYNLCLLLCFCVCFIINCIYLYWLVITLSFEPRQAVEVSKRQAKVRELPGNSEIAMKSEAAEAKLQDLKSNMNILGREAAAALAAVEAQQQRLTLQRLIAMVLQFFLMILWFFSLMKIWILVITNFNFSLIAHLISTNEGWSGALLSPSSPTNSWSAWGGGKHSSFYYFAVLFIFEK